jgi:lipopolysaccharide/colanic/teichoic acid biosynthesis glycosyltransferase
MQQDQALRLPSSPLAIEPRRAYRGKRALDMALGLVILVIFSPLMLAIAISIKLTSRGPVLYKQARLGQGGRPFTFYKFRTMYEGVDHEVHRKYAQSFIRNELPEQAEDDEAGGAIFKLTDDERITSVGHLLRRTSMDELAQIFNVLKGDMSLVGPRPALPYELQVYEEWHMQRLSAIPGMTGLWQVRGRCRVPFAEMVRMDLEYIASQSLWLDLKILLLTLPAVVSGEGAG